MTGWDRLQRVTAPTVDALSLEDAKSHLRIETDEEDADVQAMIDAAIAEIDGPRGIGLCLLKQTWRLVLDRFCGPVTLPLGPNVAVTEVTYVDTAGAVQTLAGAAYQLADGLDPAILTPVHGTAWPAARAEPGAVRIKFTAGFGEAATDVPKDLVAALKLIVGARYADREAGGVPKAASDILDRYRIFGVA